MTQSKAAAGAGRDDWLPILDEELERLPDNYRLPLVICDLEGYTRREAAQRLGWPEGTVAGRLARGRALLAERLVRRGVTLSAGAMGALLSQSNVPAALLAFTVEAAARGTMSASVAALTQEVVKTMFLNKLKASLAGSLAVLVIAAICYAVAAGVPPGGDRKSLEATVVQPQGDDQRPAGRFADAVDQFGDPLPPEALARLGTIRLRHGNVVLAIAFAPDGKSLASAGVDGTVHIWETATGKELLHIENTLEPFGLGTVEGLAYAPDGKTLAGVRMNQPPCLWDTATGKEYRQFGGERRRARWLAFSPDSKFLAYGEHRDGPTVWLAEVSSGKELRQFAAGWLVFSPDSKSVAYGGAKGDPVVRLEEVSTGKELRRFPGHQAQPIQAAFAPDGATLATADEQTLRLIEVASGRTREMARPEGQSAVAGTLVFSPHGSTLAAVGSEGKMLRIVDVATGKKIGVKEFTGKRENAWSILYTPDSKTVISGHEDGHVRFWEASTAVKAKEFRAHGSAASRLALSSDGKVLATTAWSAHGGDFSVRLWETATGKALALPLGPQAGIRFLAFSPDGRRAATVNSPGATQLWETSSGKLLRRWNGFGPLVFSVDGQTLICGSWQDGSVRVFDVVTAKEIVQFQADSKKHVHSLDLARDGKTLATTGHDHIVRLWNVVSGRQLQDFGGAQKDFVFEVRLTPDGRLLAGHNQKAILLWDTKTGKLIREHVDPESRTITGIAFSGDGKLLASSHWANRTAPSERGYYILVREVSTGKKIRDLTTPGLDTIDFSPDGRTLIGGGQHRRELFLWEVATGQLRQEFPGHQGSISLAAFAPNNRIVASGSSDGSVLIWDVTGARSRQKPAPALNAAQLDKLWNDLAAQDAASAYEAMRTLRSAPGPALALLARHLRPVPRVDPRRIAVALANLDNDNFKVRSQAANELEAMGEGAVSALRQALANNPTVEIRQRLERLLRRFEGVEAWRTGRALEVLEQIGDDAARRLLTDLAQGSSQASLTLQAQAALVRLRR